MKYKSIVSKPSTLIVLSRIAFMFVFIFNLYPLVKHEYVPPSVVLASIISQLIFYGNSFYVIDETIYFQRLFFLRTNFLKNEVVSIHIERVHTSSWDAPFRIRYKKHGSSKIQFQDISSFQFKNCGELIDFIKNSQNERDRAT